MGWKRSGGLELGIRRLRKMGGVNIHSKSYSLAQIGASGPHKFRSESRQCYAELGLKSSRLSLKTLQ